MRVHSLIVIIIGMHPKAKKPIMNAGEKVRDRQSAVRVAELSLLEMGITDKGNQ